MQFTLDRSHIDLAIYFPARKWTVDLGILRAFLGQGELEERPKRTPEYAHHLEQVLPQLEHIWADEAGRDAFVKECQQLKTERSKLWFG